MTLSRSYATVSCAPCAPGKWRQLEKLLPSRNCQVRVMSGTSTSSRISGGRRRMVLTCARCALQRRRATWRTGVRSGCAFDAAIRPHDVHQQVAIQTPPLDLVRVVQDCRSFRPCFAMPPVIGRVLVFLGAGVDGLTPVLARQTGCAGPTSAVSRSISCCVLVSSWLSLGRGFACTVGFGVACSFTARCLGGGDDLGPGKWLCFGSARLLQFGCRVWARDRLQVAQRAGLALLDLLLAPSWLCWASQVRVLGRFGLRRAAPT